MKKMVFISNNWHDAHQQTRLNALSEFDLELECLGLERNCYKIVSRFRHTSLGTIQNGKYFNRFFSYIRFLVLLPKATRSADFAYVIGFDLLLFTLLYRKLSFRKFNVIHEITDIRELFFSRTAMGQFVRRLEKLCMPSVDLLVVTSEEYITEYFTKWRSIPIKQHLVIENKIHSNQRGSSNNLPSSEEINSKIRIAYFGYLRCPASFECLLELADTHLFDIILAGSLTESTRHYATQLLHHKAVTFLSSYDGLHDMSDLYSQIDYVWAVYPYSFKKTGNHRWARTNRFYQSLFFRKPAIVQKDTADSRRAKSLGEVAVEIDLANIKEAVEYLLQALNHKNLIRMETNLATVPPSYYLITSEYHDLAQCLKLTKG